MKTDVNRGEETERILRLRCAGLSLRAIGVRVGLSHTAVANRITDALAELVTPAAEEYRQLEAARLEDLSRAAYEVLDEADTGELKLRAVDRLTKLSESRRKLLGLDATEPITVALSRRTDMEGDIVADALGAAIGVLQLDEPRRQLAVQAAMAVLSGEPLPEPLAPVVAEPGVDSEQAKREAQFRALMEADGIDPDELLAEADDDQEDDDDDE